MVVYKCVLIKFYHFPLDDVEFLVQMYQFWRLNNQTVSSLLPFAFWLK